MDSDKCVAKYLYDLVMAGNYKIYGVYCDEVHLIIHKRWFSNEKLIVKRAYGKNIFGYRGLEIESVLARKVLEKVIEDQSTVDKEVYRKKIIAIAHDLGLEKGEVIE